MLSPSSLGRFVLLSSFPPFRIRGDEGRWADFSVYILRHCLLEHFPQLYILPMTGRTSINYTNTIILESDFLGFYGSNCKL